MDCSMQGFPILHYLPAFAQIQPLRQWCYLTISEELEGLSEFNYVKCLEKSLIQLKCCTIVLVYSIRIPRFEKY